MIRSIRALLAKELSMELRTRYILNTVLAFSAASLLLILFTLRADQLDPTPRSGLVWIIILFAAMAGMARSFVAESDQKTWDLLRLHGRASDIYLGKLLYNTLFLLSLNLFTFLLYLFLMNSAVADGFYLFLAIFFGALGLASVTTLTSAMIARADRRGAIFSVLSIPLLVPLLLILTRVTRVALVGGADGETLSDTMALIGYAGVTVTTGLLLFDYIWEE
ncbi:MAG: heme exporter protein CcmB [Balneolaceae bacterium]